MLEEILMEARKFQAGNSGDFNKGGSLVQVLLKQKNTTWFVSRKNCRDFHLLSYFGWFNPHTKICYYMLFISMLLAIICYDHLTNFPGDVQTSLLLQALNKSAGGCRGLNPRQWWNLPFLLVQYSVLLSQPHVFLLISQLLLFYCLHRSHTWWLVLSKPPSSMC